MKRDDFEWLRRQFIAAIASDEELFGLLVLKGGNALSLVHDIGHRASLDIDYSTEGEPRDPDGLGRRIFAALRERLEQLGYVLFDDRFEPRPTTRKPNEDRWGGYTATFKLITREAYEELDGDVDRTRQQSIPVHPDPQAKRTFRLEISTYEYCDEKERRPIDEDTACYVYRVELIAAEKLRSLCQQMREYEKRKHPTPRARDFYDLHAVLTEGRVELSEETMHELMRVVFRAKEVPLALLRRLGDYREFHRPDWPSVQMAIPSSRHQDYDFYVDFVIAEVRKLEPLWVEDAP